MPAAQSEIQQGHALLQRLADARLETDKLFDLVRPDSLYERPIPERHRIIFYVGHLESFDWNLFRDRLFGAKPFHPEFDRLFAFGIDPVGGGLPTDQAAEWPALAAVRKYVMRVREILDEHLSQVDFSDSTKFEQSASQLLNVAIEHRLMHAETLAYMLHQLTPDQKIRSFQMPVPQGEPAESKMIPVPGGEVTLGLARRDSAFGWDNEYDAHTVSVPAFSIDQFKVSNADWLRFIEVGGYEHKELWAEGAWKWRVQNHIAHPVFWKWSGGAWNYRAMFEEIPLPLDWPVYVSHAEATAYSRWIGKSLPTEAQWHRAAYGTPTGEEPPYPWGSQPPNPKLGNFDFQRWDPAPVSAFPAGNSAFGVSGLLGNGWEWTSTLFAPFAGFEPFPFYAGYSADFFDGKHFVMKGGSARTAACMLRRSFRNWFQMHYGYVYAGFRCVSNQ